MIDPFLILAALLVLPLVLLFRFLGCDLVFQLDPVEPPPPQLFIRVRVSTALTVIAIRYRVTRPNGTMADFQETNPAPEATVDGENVFAHEETPLVGTWSVNCRVEVVDVNGNSDPDNDTGTFVLEDVETTHEAAFQTTGTPSGGDFNIIFAGLS